MAANLTATSITTQLPLIVNCSDSQDTFFAKHLAEHSRWAFYNCTSAYPWERMVRHPDMARIRVCLRAALHAKRHKAAVFISHGPRIAACAENFLRKLN